MAKLETIFCELKRGAMNALFLAAAFGSADSIDHTQNTAIAEVASGMSQPAA